MFNIIRGVPLVGFDHRKRQSMLFMPGQGGWLPAGIICCLGLGCSFCLAHFAS